MGFGSLLMLGAMGVVGAYSYAQEQEKNEKAQKISRDAQDLYDNGKELLEEEQKEAQEFLLQYGKAKINALNMSVKKFVQVYEHIREIPLKEIRGIDKISKYIVDSQKAAQLREMSNFFQNTLTEDPAGNAAFMRFGAGLTSSPSILAASVAMPSVISIGATADENLEKAETMYAEVENAFVRMRMSKIMCICISNQVEMFYQFFMELEELFSKCVYLLEGVIQRKGILDGKTVLQADDLTITEKKFAAVTCALAGIMKTMIDTPIVSEDGTLPMEAYDIYSDLRFNGFFQLSQMVRELERKLGQQCSKKYISKLVEMK